MRTKGDYNKKNEIYRGGDHYSGNLYDADFLNAISWMIPVYTKHAFNCGMTGEKFNYSRMLIEYTDGTSVGPAVFIAQLWRWQVNRQDC